MNPFNPRAIAAHRDACDEAEAIREAEAWEREQDREQIAEMVQELAGPLADLYEAAEEFRLDGDRAIEWAMASMDAERKRRHAALRARPATPDHDKEPPHA